MPGLRALEGVGSASRPARAETDPRSPPTPSMPSSPRKVLQKVVGAHPRRPAPRPARSRRATAAGPPSAGWACPDDVVVAEVHFEGLPRAPRHRAHGRSKVIGSMKCIGGPPGQVRGVRHEPAQPLRGSPPLGAGDGIGRAASSASWLSAPALDDARAPSHSASISALLEHEGGRSNPARGPWPTPASPSIGTPLAIRSRISR